MSTAPMRPEVVATQQCVDALPMPMRFQLDVTSITSTIRVRSAGTPHPNIMLYLRAGSVPLSFTSNSYIQTGLNYNNILCFCGGSFAYPVLICNDDGPSKGDHDKVV